ncbi:DUF4232 domain-containing protein [Streptomyces sp. NPDC048441]|uniref:DUF4232 domain-containing protein n=1 Tax=Streptomyces sp. NPDC048441 TaxID=3365552 RepID=UPI00371490C2
MHFTRTTTRSILTGISLVAALTLTACNDDDGSGVRESSSTAASDAPSGGGSDKGADPGSGSEGSGGQGTTAGTTAGAGSDESGKVDKCHTDELEITATDATIDGDTDGTVAVTFENGGGHGCILSGFAGVDLKTSEGDLSAVRTGKGASPMTLKDGEEVSFAIGYPLNESGGSGVRVTGLVVTPPGETKSSTLEWPGAGTLPVTDGSGSPVKVYMIGSAGQGGAR